MSVSTATRLRGYCVSLASRIESLIWSAILSGWPSVTDSEVKRRRGTRYSLKRRRAVEELGRVDRWVGTSCERYLRRRTVRLLSLPRRNASGEGRRPTRPRGRPPCYPVG